MGLIVLFMVWKEVGQDGWGLISTHLRMCRNVHTHSHSPRDRGGGGEGEFRHARAHKLFKFNFTRRFNTNKRSSIKIASQAPGKLLLMRHCWKGWVFTYTHTQKTHQLVSQSFIHTQPAVEYPNDCCFYQQRFPVLGVIHYVSHQLFWERWQFQKVFSSIALYFSFYWVIVIALSIPTHTLPEWVPSWFLSLCSQTNLQLTVNVSESRRLLVSVLNCPGCNPASKSEQLG